MSRTFYAKNIFITTTAAVATNHDGTPFINPHFPANTVICCDAEGDWFRYIGHFMEEPDTMRDPECWPSRERRGIPLFRDYWVCIDSAPGSPYYDSAINAARETIQVR